MDSTRVVIIPSYNPGRRLLQTVTDVLAVWPRVIVVDDASRDGSLDTLEGLRAQHPGLVLLRRPVNGGKGAAVLTAAEHALAQGWDHGLVFDADGQHPAAQIPEFMRASAGNSGAMILGIPVFGQEAPKIRLYGRKLSVGLVKLEVWGNRIEDPLFGFRVYPLQPLVAVMGRTRWARRYDFDPEVAVRLVWSGVPTVNLPATCRYIPAQEGGVSHFHYLRDNVRMVFLHTRLITEWLCLRWWRLKTPPKVVS